MLRTSVVYLLLSTVLFGGCYPLTVTLLARLCFPFRAGGSVVDVAGVAAGSEQIGQPFLAPRYFHGRPSATSPSYAAEASSGSNLGPSNPALYEAVTARAGALRAEDPGNQAPIPIDLVTASASGLDPEISIAAAEWQIARVARVRGLEPARVRELVAMHTRGRQLGFLGEPGVNVLALNRALDAAGH